MSVVVAASIEINENCEHYMRLSDEEYETYILCDCATQGETHNPILILDK